MYLKASNTLKNIFNLKIKDKIDATISNISEFIVYFDIMKFIKFFIYHTMFSIFGIFSVPIFLLFERIILLKNMAFLPGSNTKMPLVM